jgi:hypothetical protein
LRRGLFLLLELGDARDHLVRDHLYTNERTNERVNINGSRVGRWVTMSECESEQTNPWSREGSRRA